MRIIFRILFFWLDDQLSKTWHELLEKMKIQCHLKKTEATSLVRAEAFNKPQVNTFFTKEHKIDITMIFNLGESALNTVQLHLKVLKKAKNK